MLLSQQEVLEKFVHVVADIDRENYQEGCGPVAGVFRSGLAKVSFKEIQYNPQEKRRMEKTWSLNLQKRRAKCILVISLERLNILIRVVIKQ